MYNQAHGLDQRVEEELAMWVELCGVAPVKQHKCPIWSMLHAQRISLLDLIAKAAV